MGAPAAERKIAVNTGWSNAAEIAHVTDPAGAFPLLATNGDREILIRLAPGACTAQTASGGGALARLSLVLMHGNPPLAAGDRWATAAASAALAAAAVAAGAVTLQLRHCRGDARDARARLLHELIS